jgi:LCP family protein required for cell wall assembly
VARPVHRGRQVRLLPYAPMDSGRPPGHGSSPAHRRPRRRSLPNEAGLRALEAQAKKAAGEPPVPNEAGLRALATQIDEAHGAAPRKRRSRVKWTIGIVGGVIVLAIAGVAGYAFYLNSLINRINVGGLTGSPAQGVDQGTENILLVGSTSRCALKVQNINYGLCSQGVTGVNSDVVMILHLNPTNHSVSILSIPRDLFVPNARAEGANKIDAALFEGPTQLVTAIQDDFAIPIQHFVELNFDSFANVVDALGGISMYFPEPVFDHYSGLSILTTGCIHLDGFHALQVVRARHLQYKGPGVTSTNPNRWPQEAQSDLARIRRNHEFLRVLASAVAKKGLGDVFTDQQIVAGVAGQLTVDSGFATPHMVNLALTYHSVNINSAPQLTIPVAVDQFGAYIYKGGDYGNIEFPDQPLDQQVIDKFLGVTPNTNTMSGAPLPAPSTVTVSVLNGTGVANQAATTATALGALGFHVNGTGDTPSVSRHSETVVYYSSKSASELAAAQTVAHSLSGAVIMALNPKMISAGAQVTVVTGTSFSVNPPAAPPTTTTTAGPGTHATTVPTTTTTVPTTAGFSRPTQSVEPLAPWDPRSCTPSGKPGP